jgi:hypothetical protein
VAPASDYSLAFAALPAICGDCGNAIEFDVTWGNRGHDDDCAFIGNAGDRTPNVCSECGLPILYLDDAWGGHKMQCSQQLAAPDAHSWSEPELPSP